MDKKNSIYLNNFNLNSCNVNVDDFENLYLERINEYYIFKINNGFYNIKNIKSFSPLKLPNNLLYEFRWGYDENHMSNWIKLDISNINELIFEKEKIIYFNLKITLKDFNKTKVILPIFEFEYYVENINEKMNINSYSCIECNKGLILENVKSICFNPYNINPAVCMNSELSYIVNNMFGQEVEYFRVSPNKKGIDFFLGEYTLYNVEERKCIKILVPNNEFPQSDYKYNNFGIELQTSFEIHIDKRYWDEMFPNTISPQKGDIIYFPLLRIVYEVMDVTIFRGIMQQPIYWKVALFKYSPKSNVYETEEMRELLDEITLDTNEIFGEKMDMEKENITNEKQFSSFIQNKENNPLIEFLHKELQNIEYELKNWSIIISKNYYNLNNIKNNEIAIRYREMLSLINDWELGYTSWINIINNEKKYKIKNLIYDENKFELYFEFSELNNDIKNININDLIKIYHINGIIFYGKVIEKLDVNKFKILIDRDIIKYLNNINKKWFEHINYNAYKILKNNLIYSYDEEEKIGIIINLIANKFIEIIINNEKYLFILNDSLKFDNWYGIFINISKLYKQINVNIWERLWNENNIYLNKTNDLKNIYTYTLNNVNLNDVISYRNYSINGSNIKITNIRLLNKTELFERQPIFLNQYIIKDSSNCIIIDNALPMMNLEYLKNPK